MAAATSMDHPIVENSDLAAIVAQEIRNSTTYDQSQLSQKRSLTLEYMRGIMPDIPPRPNGSQQTSRDVNDTISWMLPSLVRVLYGTGNMVKYEQVRDEPPEWAEQATAYTNYSFFVQNDGYRILRNATYDALAMGNGVLTCYWDPEQSKTETLRSQSLEEVVELHDDPDVTILAIGEGKKKIQIDDAAEGEPAEIGTYDVKVKRILSRGKVCDETCKPENLYLNTWATTIDGARFVAYLHDNYTRSDLVEMADEYGWDADTIKNLPAGHSEMRNQVSQARMYDLIQTYSSPIRSGDQINLYRCFPRADVDGDGIAELLEVWYAGDIGGGTVLSWSVWEDDVPYNDVPCYPVPHRWDAESVADRTMDIQRVKTVLMRAALDSTYQSVMPMREVDLGSVLNPDILVNPRFGGIIWKKGGSAPIVAHEIPYTADKSFAALQAMDDLIAKRTGVSKTMMALDPDALQNQTATAAQNMRDASYSQIELVARDMAEYGWTPYFRKRLKLAVKYHEVASIPASQNQPTPEGQQPAKFQTVKPSQWDENMAVTVNTGLGTGSRDRDMAMLTGMLRGQREMAQELAMVDPGKAVEFIPKIRATAIEIAESAGLKHPESYYPEISPDEVTKWKQAAAQRAQQGDPKVASDLQMQQLKMQGEQQQQQADAQIAQIRAQAEIQSANSDAQINQLKLQLQQQQMQDRDTIAGLKLQLEREQYQASNETDIKKAALSSLTSIEVARIGAKADTDSSTVSAFLESLLNIQTHEQNKELAGIQAEQAAQVAAAKPNGAVQ